MTGGDETERGPTRCAFCERLGDRECARCEAAVCAMHHDGPMGLCAECASRAKADGRRGDDFHL